MNALTPNPREAIGGNLPPVVEFYKDVNTQLPGYLDADNVELLTRAKSLLEGFLRAPAEVADDDMAGKMSDFIKQLAAAAKAAEDKRTADKRPILEAGTIIDDYFKAIRLPLIDAQTKITARLTAYLQKKAAAEQAKRLAEERLARERAEAARVEAERIAQAAMTEADMDTAIVAEEQARVAETVVQQTAAAADVRPAELSRTYSSHGTVASLKGQMVGTITDRAMLDYKALGPYFTQDALDKAVRAAIKAGIHKIEGVHIREETKAGVR